jgi:hypothetical protein
VDGQPPDGGWVHAPGADCNDENSGVYATPGEVRNLHFPNDALTLSWTAPLQPGGTTLVYDTVRSPSAADFVTSATCVETDDGSDTNAVDGGTPGPGLAWFYLVRAENACPSGQGPLGSDSDGLPRTARTCP